MLGTLTKYCDLYLLYTVTNIVSNKNITSNIIILHHQYNLFTM